MMRITRFGNAYPEDRELPDWWHYANLVVGNIINAMNNWRRYPEDMMWQESLGYWIHYGD